MSDRTPSDLGLTSHGFSRADSPLPLYPAASRTCDCPTCHEGSCWSDPYAPNMPCSRCTAGRVDVPVTEPWRCEGNQHDHPVKNRSCNYFACIACNKCGAVNICDHPTTRPCQWTAVLVEDQCLDADGNVLRVYLVGPGSVVEVIDANGCEHAVLASTLTLDLDPDSISPLRKALRLHP